MDGTIIIYNPRNEQGAAITVNDIYSRLDERLRIDLIKHQRCTLSMVVGVIMGNESFFRYSYGLKKF